MKIKTFIFDLDGVIVSTDQFHYQAWKKLAEEEQIPYNYEVNKGQRGVSRMESLEVMLKNTHKQYTPEQKLEMADRKNSYYQELIKSIRPSDTLKGVDAFLAAAKAEGIKCAIGSSSKNTKAILAGIRRSDFFDAVADGTQITHSKPNPEVLLLAASLTGTEPAACVVFEDAAAGIEAAKAAGMKAVAVGDAKENPMADISAEDLSALKVGEIITLLEEDC